MKLEQTFLESRYMIFCGVTSLFKKTNLPWFVVRREDIRTDNLFSFDRYINGLILPGTLSKPVYVCKSQFKNKYCLLEFVPIVFTEKKIILEEERLGENKIRLKYDDEEYTFSIEHSPLLSIEEIIPRIKHKVGVLA